MKFPIRFYCALGVSAALLAFLPFRVILTKISNRSGNAVQWNGGINQQYAHPLLIKLLQSPFRSTNSFNS